MQRGESLLYHYHLNIHDLFQNHANSNHSMTLLSSMPTVYLRMYGPTGLTLFITFSAFFAI